MTRDAYKRESFYELYVSLGKPTDETIETWRKDAALKIANALLENEEIGYHVNETSEKDKYEVRFFCHVFKHVTAEKK